MDSNIVLLGKIEGMVWYTIYCHLPPSINQPTSAKRTSMYHIISNMNHLSSTAGSH
jgi:hypothetical protein